MKNLLYLFLLLVVFITVSCGSSRTVTTTDKLTTRKADTLYKIPAREATFIPIHKDLVEFKKINGINVIIHYREVHITNDTVILQVETISVETEPEEVKIIIDETIKEESKVKEIIGIPWFYKLALYFSLGIVALIVIKLLLKQLPG